MEDADIFEVFLNSKKIDAKAFLKAEPEVFLEWIKLFSEVHPDSFVMQKKFLINAVRRKYLLQ